MINTEAATETNRSRTQSPIPPALGDTTGAGSNAGRGVIASAATASVGDIGSGVAVSISLLIYSQPRPPGGHTTRARLGFSIGLGWLAAGTSTGENDGAPASERFPSSTRICPNLC